MLEKLDAVDAQSIEKCKMNAALPISFALCMLGQSARDLHSNANKLRNEHSVENAGKKIVANGYD